MRRLLITATVALLAFPGLSPVLAQDQTIVVAVHCSVPESASISNESSAPITVMLVGSLFRPRENEPFRRNDPLQPMESLTYGFGPDDMGINLTDQSIFAPDEPAEG